jgi:acetyltransferase-like isoleucine patch superfamily enzyme
MNEQPLVQMLSEGKVSARAQYERMFVGRPGLVSLLKYELCMSWPSQMSGAVGYLARKKLFARLVRQCGRGCLFGRGVLLRSPGNISFGDAVILDDLVVVDAKGEGSAIELGNQVLVSRYGNLSCNQAVIRLGDFCSIGPNCYISSRSMLEIGSNTSIGPGSQIVASGHAFDDPHTPVVKQKRVSQGIRIGDGCWIGAGSIIMDGAVIGDNCIIGAGAVVKGEIPPYSVAVGMPAKVLYDRRDKAAAQPAPPVEHARG